MLLTTAYPTQSKTSVKLVINTNIQKYSFLPNLIQKRIISLNFFIVAHAEKVYWGKL